jgi:hypothetical protein
MAALQHLDAAVLNPGVCALFEPISMSIHEDHANVGDEFASAERLS